ncbi:hypothetical protein [Streptomyces himalayensis]|uniref:Uncharacterized protein n=1 Tax=Streptomyces himalayensis subsp. himalayensis TaxID=2756131 RepID=A0A7W0DUE4_9ACTN|nr:hypothetical protein [Streptomyces himalayensis]MBA2951417.1 hypothetical protein [Streptomyces himalayensis subsp. himalayensis]
MIFPETEIRYVPGASFACFKRPIISPDGETGPECGAEIVMHGFWWCAQVCPSCLANYFTSGASSQHMGLDTAGFYPADTAARVRETIAANGGQYVPQF